MATVAFKPFMEKSLDRVEQQEITNPTLSKKKWKTCSTTEYMCFAFDEGSEVTEKQWPNYLERLKFCLNRN